MSILPRGVAPFQSEDLDALIFVVMVLHLPIYIASLSKRFALRLFGEEKINGGGLTANVLVIVVFQLSDF